MVRPLLLLLLLLTVGACGDATVETGGGDKGAVGADASSGGSSYELANNKPGVLPPLRDVSSSPRHDGEQPEHDAGAPAGDAAEPDDTATTGDQPQPQCPPDDPALACDELPLPRYGWTRYPIVLVHGMGGFDQLGSLEYFHGVPAMLREHGHAVFVADPDAFNSTEVRVDQLEPMVDRILACTCAEKVNLVGHSQGGLDSRYLVAVRGYADRVESIVTIATPHRGSPVSDMALGLVEGPQQIILDALVGLWGAPATDANLSASMRSVSVEHMTEHNERWPDPPELPIYSWAGVTGQRVSDVEGCRDAEIPPPDEKDAVLSFLVATYEILGGAEVPNDGMVQLSSARWGRFMGCVAADHANEIGQIAGMVPTFDYMTFYRDVAQHLVDEGH